mmetsp:Transcript_64102/g.71617  ORF Transcript_64102/g.71617 Transcript_64102/m.71617 type:complete len:91 (+) Transcript_64102:321-593(+)
MFDPTTIQGLLEEATALLAATVLCGERKCYATMVNMPYYHNDDNTVNHHHNTQHPHNHHYIALLDYTLTVEKGSIAVAAGPHTIVDGKGE